MERAMNVVIYYHSDMISRNKAEMAKEEYRDCIQREFRRLERCLS